MGSPCLFMRQCALKMGYFYWLHVKNLDHLHTELSLGYLEDAKFYLESKASFIDINSIASFGPRLHWSGQIWSKLCTDPCKHHCNRICTDPCKQAVQEQNSSVQKFVWTHVNGALSCFCLLGCGNIVFFFSDSSVISLKSSP